MIKTSTEMRNWRDTMTLQSELGARVSGALKDENVSGAWRRMARIQERALRAQLTAQVNQVLGDV